MSRMPKARASKDPSGNRHTKKDVGGLEATEESMKRAIKTPCAECPLRKDSVPGYLGGYSPDMYLDIMFSPASIACHSSPGFQEGKIGTQRVCTGVAAFRAHMGFIASVPIPTARGPSYVPTKAHESTQFVGSDPRFFETPEEFLAHHQPGQEPDEDA